MLTNFRTIYSPSLWYGIVVLVFAHLRVPWHRQSVYKVAPPRKAFFGCYQARLPVSPSPPFVGHIDDGYSFAVLAGRIPHGALIPAHGMSDGIPFQDSDSCPVTGSPVRGDSYDR